MKRFVLDTNVLIEAMRDGEAEAELVAWQRRMAPFVFQHSVVIAELLVGAWNELAWKRWHRRWVEPAERLGRVIVPTYATWLRASRIISQLAGSERIPKRQFKTRFFNDCLIAATCREHGHSVVTHNLDEFALIATVEPSVRFFAPLP